MDTTMNNVLLKDINYFGFDNKGNDLPLSSTLTTTWIAVATLDYEVNKDSDLAKPLITIPVSNKHQKYAVRNLLYKWVFKQFEQAGFHYIANYKITDSLNYNTFVFSHFSSYQHVNLYDTKFPYRILPFNYYVCFSHSGNQVTCAINKYCPIGIDTEINTISLQVAQRFYTSKEIEWLQQLSPSQQPEAISILWMLKEASIKKTMTNEANLLTGLKASVLLPAQNLLLSSNNENSSSSSNVHNFYYHQDIRNRSKSTTCVYLPNYKLIAIW